ncbi:DUF3440 domain-containing protein [Conchiformibius steedae]|uniref:DUF3440 domain-containing protein n=1 Tax=Conchiformibius steedae TaxID=153493 RepID=UPI0026F20FC2|nr:DUF3440 domain-containing protein [Conchiformibius steedae]
MNNLRINVYEALKRRLNIIFSEFDNVYVSFSGGKDSGLLLELTLQYMREHGITRKIGVMHQDFEAQYTATTDYVTRVMLGNSDLIEPFWLCLPMAVDTSASAMEQYWYPWQRGKEDIWVRPMPDYPCVIKLDNHQFDFYQENMHQADIYKHFGAWYHAHCGGKGKTIGLVGIRAQESLNRWRAITQDKHTHRNLSWTTHNPDGTYTAHPLYDWQFEDVWAANAKFGFDYNKIYDLMYYAGVNPAQMRVASPFSGPALPALNLYRVLEPLVWAKLIGRVNGANFAALYAGTKALGWKHIELPEGHTWQSFVEFLLATLPEKIADNYRAKFATSIKFWKERGGVLSKETIKELRQMGIKCTVSRTPSNYKTDKMPVRFNTYPDDAPVHDFMFVPSYKRMAVTILKNDHTCKYMGFSQTKAQNEKRKKALEEYAKL